MLTIGVPRETLPGEQRVAATPETVAKLVATGAAVLIEAGAGVAAGHLDEAYTKAGARIAPDAASLYAEARVILKVREPGSRGSGHEADQLAPGSALVSFLALDRHPDLIERLSARQVTAFAMERIPRTTRAQRMDALSSMSTVAGYKAVLLGAGSLGRFFPLLMTAAGTIAPARVFVLGAGVAGLQAIATARRLGAVVEAFDVRPAAREEVQSLGATFVAAELTDAGSVAAGGYAKAQTQDQEQRTRDRIRPHVAQADVVIATANVPGRKAPVLVSADMVREMKPGSVIVDLAAEGGGNCELTRAGETTVAHGVTLLGPVNLAASLPFHASQMYARNLVAFVQLMIKEGALTVDFADDILDATCVTHAGKSRIQGAAPAAALAGSEARS
jgi:H+-translocating NAD(P) transhydrogenase subunit alpha